MSELSDRYRRLLGSGDDTARIEFFSDAVFAIALTLLVLDIRIPEGTADADLGSALLALWPQFFAYLLTFAILGLNWVSHHRKFTVIERYDGGLMWLNLAFLMFVALTPFTTSVLSGYGAELPAVLLYAAVIVGLGSMQAIMWAYARSRGLLADSVDRALYVYVLRNILVAPIVFAVSIGIAFWEPLIAMLVWILNFPASLVVQRIPIRGGRDSSAVSRSRG